MGASTPAVQTPGSTTDRIHRAVLIVRRLGAGIVIRLTAIL
jgi:hypothetical protein